MIELGFWRAFTDYCIYVRQNAHSKCIVGLHVDDFVIAATPIGGRTFLQEFEERFSVKDLGSAQFVVRLQIQQQGEDIILS